MSDYYDDKLQRSGDSLKLCGICFLGIVIGLVLALLTSCTTTKYVPVEVVRTEYKTRTDSFIQKDSIFVKDSVLIATQGDTVHYHHWHIEYRDRASEKAKTDTFIKCDSIPVPYPVERKLTKWEQTKINWGGEAIAGIIFVFFIIIWLIIKKLQR